MKGSKRSNSTSSLGRDAHHRPAMALPDSQQQSGVPEETAELLLTLRDVQPVVSSAACSGSVQTINS